MFKEQEIDLKKFKSAMNITSSAKIKDKRAKMLAEDIQASLYTQILNKQKTIRDIEREIERKCDFGPDTEYSLKVNKDDFDASDWVSELSQKKVDLRLKQIELEIDMDTYAELFGNPE